MSKTKPRVLKLYKPLCFKTSILLETTGVRARSDFDNGEQTYHRNA
ncbi:hypothetical protein HMPREF9554_02450 [Treponema phagedenis F0421]|nr:hypothetical protein HMPREF9554_02450 [Treponema phagedenis F0421]